MSREYGPGDDKVIYPDVSAWKRKSDTQVPAKIESQYHLIDILEDLYNATTSLLQRIGISTIEEQDDYRHARQLEKDINEEHCKLINNKSVNPASVAKLQEIYNDLNDKYPANKI